MIFYDNYFGKNTIIEPNVRIGNSKIGSNCVIGENSKIINCRIHNRVYIGENCILNTCKVRSHSNLNKNVRTDNYSKLIFLDHSSYDNAYIINEKDIYQEIGGRQCLISAGVTIIR
jgi:NDP-sugar pyrophosphorylase family protein